MEHIFFEVQLCIKISIFKEISNIDILIILCLLTSLKHVFPGELCSAQAKVTRSDGFYTIGPPKGIEVRDFI